MPFYGLRALVFASVFFSFFPFFFFLVKKKKPSDALPRLPLFLQRRAQTRDESGRGHEHGGPNSIPDPIAVCDVPSGTSALRSGCGQTVCPAVSGGLWTTIALADLHRWRRLKPVLALLPLERRAG